MNSKDILNYIELALNDISLAHSLDIVFRGGLDVVDDNYRRKMFNLEVTPFALATNQFEPKQEGNVIDFRYALYIMAYEYDRPKYDFILDELDRVLRDSPKINGFNITFRPVNCTTGLPFSENSGSGIQRFEILYTFQGSATKYYSMRNDLSIEIDNQPLQITSFKFNHGKISYINLDTTYNNANNSNVNTNTLIIEAPLSPDNFVLTSFLMTQQAVNIDKRIKMMIGTNQLLNDMFEYEGFSLASTIEQNNMSVYLYFSYAKEKISITINDITIPILDFAIGMKTMSLPVDRNNSNRVKNIYTNKAVSYAFNIAEEKASPLINLYMDDLLGDSEKVPLYNVTMTIHDKVYNVDVLIDEISKESKETANSIIKVVFLESGELDG